MRLKSFYAKTMTEAMQMVRDTLGEDAVIVATREERGSRTVHVTAAVDSSPAFEIGKTPSTDWLQYDAEEDSSAVAEELTDVMLRHGVTEDVMDQIISCATVIGMEKPAVALVASIEHLFNFRPLPQKPSRKPLMAVGAPGAGKTLAIAKIAARSVMNPLKVGVITTDTVRAGGIEQLEAFTRLLRVPLHKAGGPEELREVLEQMRDYDQILIDTAGLNPFNGDEVKYLAELIAASDADPYMILPAGSDAEESGEMARIFGTLGVHGLIPTRVDIARRLGGLLSAASWGSMVFADASNTPKVADGLFTLTPQTLSELLMPAAFNASKKNRGAAMTSMEANIPDPLTGAPSFRRGKNILAVASGKGGVGKTWFSITLTHALSRMGKKVLLFDGDLGLANVDVQLGLMPKRDLNDVIRGRLSLDRVIQPFEDGGFDIIAGRSGQASLSALPSQRLALLRDQLIDVSASYDVVVCDLGAGVDRTVRMLSASATRTVLLATDEPTSLTDAYAFIKLGNAAGLSRNVSIVINMAPSVIEGEKTYKTLLKACENFLRIKPPMAGIIRQDPKVKDSIRHQTPILTRSPNSDAAGDVEKIARELLRSLTESRAGVA